MKQTIHYKSSKDFGRSLGLSDIDIELIQQKRRLITKIKEARLKAKISQAKLAEMVESKQPAIARMEGGQVSQVSMDFLIRVALALSIDVIIRPLKEAA